MHRNTISASKVRRRDQLYRFIAETRSRIAASTRAGEVERLRGVERAARVELESLGDGALGRPTTALLPLQHAGSQHSYP